MTIDRSRVLNASLLLNAGLTFCYTISSFFVAGNANNGFNVVITGLLFAVFTLGALMILNKTKTAISVGFVLGVSATLTMQALMTAIYWGQLGGCDEFDGEANQCTCHNPSAMRAVAAFAVLIFLNLMGFTGGLVMWKDDFTSEASVYDDISSNDHLGSGIANEGYAPYNAGGAGGAPYQGGGTADL